MSRVWSVLDIEGFDCGFFHDRTVARYLALVIT